MARLFDDILEESLQVNQAILSGTPLAMVCWYKSDSLTKIKQTLIGISNDVDAWTTFRLYLWGYLEEDTLVASAEDSVDVGPAHSSIKYSINVWQHGCGIWASSTDRRVFLNGTNKGTDVTDLIPSNLNVTNIGVANFVSMSGYMSGHIAEAAIWDLSGWPGANDVERADAFEKIVPSLAKGYSPLFFPLGLKAYWPLIRNANDRVGGYNLE